MSQETKQPKRRWLRFSLRSFLIVLTIFCVWLGWYLYRVERQRKAVEWVLGNGGVVYYDYQLDSKGVLLKNSQPRIPKWLHDMLGVDYFSTVTNVNLLGVIDVTPLANLKNLKSFSLHYSQVSDLTPLAGLPNLEVLLLDHAQVSDLTPLAGLAKLEELWLSGTQVSDLYPLAGLAKLENLHLRNTQVSDEEIEKLQLALPNCNIIRWPIFP